LKVFMAVMLKLSLVALAASLGCALSLVAVPAHAQLPSLGSAGDLPLSTEKRIGQSVAKSIYQDPDLLTDPFLQAYIDDMFAALRYSARLRGEMPVELDERFAWKAFISKERDVNAFALPGGYFGVYSGLMLITQSRDELATVLAHELVHVTQRHISRSMTQQSQQAPWVMAASILAMLAAAKNPEAAQAAIVGTQAVAAQNQLNFSRDMEREADRIGFSLLLGAGYRPQAAPLMFERLQQSTRLNDSGAYPYLRSHPLNLERIADMRLRTQEWLGDEQKAAGSTAAGPTRARAEMDGLLQRAAHEDVLHALMLARAKVFSNAGIDNLKAYEADALRALQTPLADGTKQLAVLYTGWLAAWQAKDLALAQNLLQALNTAWPKFVKPNSSARWVVDLTQAQWLIERGAPKDALALVDAAVATGQHSPRTAVLVRTQALSAAGEHAQATDALQNWLLDNPQDSGAWRAMAQVHTAAKRGLRAVEAEARAHEMEYDLQGALDRLRAAQTLAQQTGAHHVDASVIDTRMRAVQTALREQAAEARASR
jgi:predicted Zn-dependent protease